MAAKPHVLMISVDGMRPEYATLAEKHGLIMPVLRQMMQAGAYADGVQGVGASDGHAVLVTGVPAVVRDVPTLWQAAREAGLTTASVGWSSPQVTPYMTWAVGTASDEHATDLSVAMIRELQPNFMTVHLTHAEEVQRMYGSFSKEASVAMEAADASVGEMIAAELAMDPKAIVVVVSDHGWATERRSDLSQTRASFFAMGNGVKMRDDLGVIDMLQIAPTVAKMLHVALPRAQGRPVDVLTWNR